MSHRALSTVNEPDPGSNLLLRYLRMREEDRGAAPVG